VPASAQSFTYNPRPPKPSPRPVTNDGKMTVQAVEVDYDYNNQRVSAVGNVQMFYNGTSVEADKVIFDQKTKRLHAEGNIRLTDAEGKVTYANIMDLSDDYRDGFVDSLRVDTADATRMAATRADRSAGNYTVFEKRRVYRLRALQGQSEEGRRCGRSRVRVSSTTRPTRCCISKTRSSSSSACRWRICRISRRPIRPLKRKTGFLMPSYTTVTGYGYGVETPFYWAIAPDYDATFNPRFTTRRACCYRVNSASA